MNSMCGAPGITAKRAPAIRSAIAATIWAAKTYRFRLPGKASAPGSHRVGHWYRLRPWRAKPVPMP